MVPKNDGKSCFHRSLRAVVLKDTEQYDRIEDKAKCLCWHTIVLPVCIISSKCDVYGDDQMKNNGR